MWLQPIWSSTNALHAEHLCQPSCRASSSTACVEGSSGQSVPMWEAALQMAQVFALH